MPLKHFWLLCIVLVHATVFAQQACDLTLSGRVIDEHDGEPLSYAEIIVDSGAYTTISDYSGYYRIGGLCPQTIVVECRHLGCDPVSAVIEMRTDVVHDFYPEHHSELLDAISVIAQQATPNVVRAVSILENTPSNAGKSLGGAVEKEVGVTMLQTGASIAKPVIHGLHSNRLLVMNNGVRQEGQQWGNEHAPEIDPSIAGEFEVVKGASSVRYGPDAIAGVLLVKPRPLPDSSGVAGAMQLSGQTNGRGGATSAFVEGRSKRMQALRWRGQGSLKKLGSMEAPSYVLKNTGFEEFNFSAAASLSDSVKGVEVFYSQFNTNLGILSGSHIGNLSDLQRAFESTDNLEQDVFSYQIARPFQRVEHEMFKGSAFWKTGNTGHLKLVYGRQYNLREEYDTHRGDGEAPALKLEIVTHSADLIYSHRIRSVHHLSYGAQGLFQENTFEGRFFIPNFRKLNAGLFIIDKVALHSGWIVELGARFDHLVQSVFLNEFGSVRNPVHRYSQTSFNVGAVKRFGQAWQSKFNVATGWRPPNVNELYSNGLHHGAATFEVGDTSLVSEVSYSAIASVQYSGKKLNVTTEAYVNFMDDFIYLAPRFPATLTIRGAFPTFGFEQTDALLYGFNSRLEMELSESFAIQADVALLRARNLVAKDWLVLMPPDQGSIGLNYTRAMRDVKCFVTPKAQLVNEQWRVPANSDYVAPPAGYVLASVEAGMTMNNSRSKRTHFSIEINNLFNTSYRNYLNRYRYFADELGRNFILKFSRDF